MHVKIIPTSRPNNYCIIPTVTIALCLYIPLVYLLYFKPCAQLCGNTLKTRNVLHKELRTSNINLNMRKSCEISSFHIHFSIHIEE